MANLWCLPAELGGPTELFECLAQGERVRIERIVSCGQCTPAGQWYDQPQDEWVVLLQGSAHLAFADGRTRVLNAGDWLVLPAHCRHRVEYTSREPPCIWLAVHARLSGCVSPSPHRSAGPSS